MSHLAIKTFKVLFLTALFSAPAAGLVNKFGVPEQFYFVPDPNDHRLAGEWTTDAKWPSRKISQMKMDGSGQWFHEKWGRPSLRWGTNNGNLVVRYGSTDAFVRDSYRYSLSADAKTLILERNVKYGGGMFGHLVFMRIPEAQ